MTYQTIFQPSEIRREIRRSVFIGRAIPLASMEEAQAFWQDQKAREPRANHHCYCAMVGAGQEQQVCSDDGEPQGTAGLPMLEVLKKKKVTNLAVVVTRYFGGIKLGASGLVRAYSHACRDAVEAGRIVEVKPFLYCLLELDYSQLGAVEHWLSSRHIRQADRHYSDRVLLPVFILEEEAEGAFSQLQQLTGGKIHIRVEGKEFLPLIG